MTPCQRPAFHLCLLGLLWIGSPPLSLATDDTPAPKAPALDRKALPEGIEIDSYGTFRQTENGDIEFTGPVTVLWQEMRIQADRLTLSERRHVEAEGNVLLVWGRNRVFGSRLTYDLEADRGEIEDVIGEVLDQYLFWAEHVEKIGGNRLHLTSATVTTCTQPLPYWSFEVSSATITIEHYARMWNVRLRAGKAPVVYLPYLIWPVKEGRAAGLLMPEVQSTQARGRVFRQELFIPLGRSADLTLEGRHYSEAGFGGGGKLRFIPNAAGRASLDGFFIHDEFNERKNQASGAPLEPEQRYRAAYQQEQRFRNGFRMLADINLVSDFDYYTDFEREFELVASPTILARLEFSRNGPWTSLNVRELRREQLRSNESSLVQQTLPEIEWRGRSRRLGRTPLVLSFESSLASIQQRDRDLPSGSGTPLDADYRRADAHPTLTWPFSPTPWLDITPRVDYRFTHWTQSRAADGSVEDEALTRQLWAYGLEFVGPKLFRLYRPEARDARRYKHTIETRVRYGFDPSFDEQGEILAYDEVDSTPGAGNEVSYALVQRLFSQRPRAAAEPPPQTLETILLPDGTTDDPALAEPTEPAPPGPSEPIEIASLEIGQRRSFDEDLSVADLDVDSTLEEASRFSPITLRARYNPEPYLSLDAGGSYDILYRQTRDLSISGSVTRPTGRLRLSWVRRNGLNAICQSDPSTPDPQDVACDREPDSQQMRVSGGLSLFDERIQFDLDANYDARSSAEGSHFPIQRWRAQYSTQCCTFFLERLTQEFDGEDRRDLYFRIDLRGVGKLLTHTF